jgi:low temperature requirement protein LtrA
VAEQPEEEEVQVTWFELFFDLVFVVAISKIAAPLEEVETLFSGVTGVYVLRITCVWWVWHTATGCADVIRQGAAMWLMTFTTLALVCFAARACQRNDNSSFLYFYAASRVLNTATYLWLLVARGKSTLSAAKYKAFRFLVLSNIHVTFAEAGLAFTAAALANGPSGATTVPTGACIGCWITLAAMWPTLRTAFGLYRPRVEQTEERPFDVSRVLVRLEPKHSAGQPLRA